MICQVCQDDDDEFSVPADKIGIALMKRHLANEHDVPEHEMAVD